MGTKGSVLIRGLANSRGFASLASGVGRAQGSFQIAGKQFLVLAAVPLPCPALWGVLMFLETKTENTFQCTLHYFKCSVPNFQNELQGYVNPDLGTIFNTEQICFT